MAKKKRQPKKNQKASQGRPPKAPRAKAEIPDRLPDRRAIESVMWNMFGGGSGAPVEQAQAVMYGAFQETDPARRAALARKALELSPDSADAYVLLAEHAQSRKEALELYQQAVAAGERALGPRAFRDDVGHFWGLLETRPYMRAREGLAHALWSAGRRDEAAAHLREMLRLNPGDNQGVRYTLASWLLSLDQDAELARLLEQYDEGTATWAYARALLAYRRHGDSPEARAQLEAARKANAHVPAYLLGEKPLPREYPAYYSFGDESEAVMYVTNALSAWRSSAGALTWLRAVTHDAAGTARAKPPRAAGPTAAQKGRLKRLAQVPDTWEADCRPVGTTLEHEGALVEAWIALVASVSNGLIVAHAIIPEPPTAALMWEVLAEAMSEPLSQEPHRPTELRVRANPIWSELRRHFEDIGVACTEVDDLEDLDVLLNDLAAHLTRDEPPGLLDIPGMTPERASAFYRASADFYRKAPWNLVDDAEAIRVECDRYESGPWYAVVMGQAGLTLGLTLYEDLDLLRRMWAGALSDEESGRRTTALTVTFDRATETPTADLSAARQHGWEVAGPEAYPWAFRKEPGLSMRPPLTWELDLLEACLRAIPDFMSRHKPGDTKTQRTTVPVGSTELTLVLSWVGPQ